MSDSPLPAHNTKHLHTLSYPFKDALFLLSQLNSGITNGTALWLGAQCLSSYLVDSHKKFASHTTGKRLRAVELGSGIGLTALALSSLGWDVLATDIPNVISTVLVQNVERNLPNLPLNSGTIQVRELDWMVSPEEWIWNDDKVIASSATLSLPSSPDHTANLLTPPFDLIVTSDTLYVAELAQPLLRTLHALCVMSAPRPPPIYLCIERRDSALIDQTLTDAKDIWKFSVERIPHKKFVKSMKRGGIRWDKAEWEDIELWKLTLTDSA